MKIGIIGGGASGTFLAIRLKEKDPSLEVTIIEKNDKLLKKVLVTGNGRCNYANVGNLTDKYNDSFANALLKKFTPQDIISAFERYGVHPTYLDQLVFPVSLSAQTIVLMLNKMINIFGVDVRLDETCLDYQKTDDGFIVRTNKNSYQFDKLVFTSGGKAYPQLGTDGAVLDLLKKHGYQINKLSPSLSPIKVKENTKKISGQRVKCHVSLLNNKDLVYEEDGEVLFKDDGLSGIVILNMSSVINRLEDKSDIKVVLNLAPSSHELDQDQYYEYVSPKIADYLINNNLDIHNLTYTFKGFYDFEIAEVSHGGLSLEEVTDSLESKKEEGLYFAGEVLDIDGMCGGYNLMFAFASAEAVKKAI